MKFAENLKNLRKERKITQSDLGKAIGKSNRVISYYENEEHGSSVPPMEMIEKIADFFEITVADLLGNEIEDNREILVRYLIDSTLDSSIEWNQLSAVDYQGKTTASAIRMAISKIEEDEKLKLNYHDVYFTILNNIVIITKNDKNIKLYILKSVLKDDGFIHKQDLASYDFVGENYDWNKELYSIVSGDHVLVEEVLLISTLDYLKSKKKNV